MTRPSWDDTYIEMCDVLAKRSKDERTQIGCMIVGPRHEIRAMGYNCFPRGINDDVKERQERPLKYLYFEHAERNALYNAASVGVPLELCTVYLPCHPCADCARGLISVGIAEVVCASNVIPERFAGNCAAAVEMLNEAGILVRVANTDYQLTLEVSEDTWGAPTRSDA